MATQDRSSSPQPPSAETHADASAEAHAISDNAAAPTDPSTTPTNGDGSDPQTVLCSPGRAKAVMADDQGGQPATLNHGSPVCPSSPQQADGKQLPRPKFKDEKMLQSYIAKAHAQVREGTPVTSSREEQERSVVKYAEMVSQMTQLLAAAGVGRNTTVRALAYLSAPDPPEVKTALRQAKLDRREQNIKKRQASEASSAARKDELRASDSTDCKTPSTSTSNNSSDGSLSATNPTPGESGQTSLTEMSVAGTDKSGNPFLEPSKVNAVTDATQSSAGTAMQKKRFTRKWWPKSRRRNRASVEKANERAMGPAATEKTQTTDTGSKLAPDSSDVTPPTGVTAVASPTP